MAKTVLDNFKEIVYVKPADIIINQIKNLIGSGQLSWPLNEESRIFIFSSLYGVVVVKD